MKDGMGEQPWAGEWPQADSCQMGCLELMASQWAGAAVGTWRTGSGPLQPRGGGRVPGAAWGTLAAEEGVQVDPMEGPQASPHSSRTLGHLP